VYNICYKQIVLDTAQKIKIKIKLWTDQILCANNIHDGRRSSSDVRKSDTYILYYFDIMLIPNQYIVVYLTSSTYKYT